MTFQTIFLGKTYFTTLDLVRAYYNVPVEECDISKTAVITPFGLFEFNLIQAMQRQPVLPTVHAQHLQRF